MNISRVRSAGVAPLAARAGKLGFMLCLAACTAAAAPRPQETGAHMATLQQIAGLLERGDIVAASRAIELALTAHPADPVLHNFAGVIAAQQSAFESAEAHFQTAIQLAPQAGLVIFVAASLASESESPETCGSHRMPGS